MYPKYFIALAAFSLFAFASCRTTHTMTKGIPAPVHTIAATTAATNNNIAYTNVNHAPATTARAADSIRRKKSSPPIIEKGGKYVMIPPAYMRLRPESGADHYNAEVLQQKIDRLKKYAVAHHYNTRVALFIDMHVKSNRNRFFVVNLQTGMITKQGLVAHGRGTEKFTFNHRYSNGVGSNCTSLGMYKIGKGYKGAFGLSYKLFGLENTNSNALHRYVVLHAMGAVPEQESPYPIVQSEGCPAVAPAFLSGLAPVIDHAQTNILLYIYDSAH